MSEGLVKFSDYSELNSIPEKKDIVIIKMKDGTQYYLTNKDELSKYSNRPETESFMFFYNDSTSTDAGATVDAGQATVATVGVESKPVEAPPKSEGLFDPSTFLTGAIAGVIGAAAGPFLANLAKDFVKSRMKGRGKEQKKDDEVTDCKTHQISTNGKFHTLHSRVAALEEKMIDVGGDDINFVEDFDNLMNRVKKLEKALKPPKAPKPKPTPKE